MKRWEVIPLKKIACLFLIVLLVSLMAVPAFSVINMPDRYDIVCRMHEKAVLALGESRLSEYPYYTVFAGQKNTDSCYMFFFRSPSPRVGDSLLYYSYTPSSDYGAFTPGDFSLSVITVRSNELRGSVGGRALISFYIVEDYSTAKLSYFSIQSDRDFYINVLGDYVDISFLESLLQESKDIENIGYTSSSWSTFQVAIQSALDLLEQPEYTQAQIDDAFKALQDAKNALVLLPDTSELESLLAACKALSSGSYTPSSYAALKTAMIEAETVLGFVEYTEQQIMEAYSALESARDSLVLLPDTSELENLLSACKAISVDSYTAKSYSVLQSAIKQVENLLTQLDYTDSDIADAISSLQSAKDNLVEISASDAALRQNLLLFIEILLSSIAEIVPIAILVFGIVACALLVPRVLKWFF